MDGGILRSHLQLPRIRIPELHATAIPLSLIGDLGLDVPEFRVYCHYLFACDDDGYCLESVRATARKCGMSPASVCMIRRNLQSRGLIEISTFNAEFMLTEMLLRPRNSCQLCGAKDRLLIQHHVIPKSEGGNDDPSNRVLLCPSCHYRVHSPMVRVVPLLLPDERLLI